MCDSTLREDWHKAPGRVTAGDDDLHRARPRGDAPGIGCSWSVVQFWPGVQLPPLEVAVAP